MHVRRQLTYSCIRWLRCIYFNSSHSGSMPEKRRLHQISEIDLLFQSIGYNKMLTFSVMKKRCKRMCFLRLSKITGFRWFFNVSMEAVCHTKMIRRWIVSDFTAGILKWDSYFSLKALFSIYFKRPFLFPGSHRSSSELLPVLSIVLFSKESSISLTANTSFFIPVLYS